MHFNEASGGVRKFPVAVDERFGRFFKGRAVFGRSKGLVKGQTLRDVGHIGRGEERRGVKIDMTGAALKLDLYLTVRYGTPIPEVAENAQKAVSSAVEAMTGCSVEAVNIHVGGVTTA